MHRALAADGLLLFALTGCVTEPLVTSMSTNPDVRVDTLFTHDGCTVYRFRDVGFHYYVRCAGTPAEVLPTRTKAGDDAAATVIVVPSVP